MAFHRHFLKIPIFAILTSAALSASGQSGDFQSLFPKGTLSDILIGIADWVGTIGIPVAAFFLILTGFMFVSAQGNEERLKEARRMLVWTVMGTAVILGAPFIARMIIDFAKDIGAA